MTTRFVSLTLSAVLAAGSIFAMQAVQDQPAPSSAPAQAAQHKPEDPNKQLKRLANKLALTADQQNQILPILTDRQQQVQSIQNDASLSAKDRHQKMKTVRTDSEAKLRAVLTDTQKQAYDQMQQENRERAKAHRQTTVNPI